MFRLPKKMLFAIEAVLDIAYNGADRPVQSAEITSRQGIPRRYLEQVLQQLVRVDILAGVRGPRGGYRLARERRRISIGDIVRSVRALEGGDEGQAEFGSALGRQIVQPTWQELQDEAMRRLDALSVEDLCGRARESGIKRIGVADADFSI
jgi:Rrf2 family iron-sulfur cluster assembly transcriptional regulator